MIRINIQEAKTHLSRYLARLKPGQVLLLCRRNVPVAEIRAIAERPRAKRQVGLARGAFVVPAEFFEPLPEDLLDAFEKPKP